MAPKTYGDEDEEPEVPYHESSDEDFNPDSAPADDAATSSEDEDTAPAHRKGKRKAPIDDELDSGDEVTIEAARKKRAKKRKKGGKGDNGNVILSEDEGGDGGLIKTRAQRAVEKTDRRPLARTEGATVDVDALWAQMTAAPLRPPQPKPAQSASATHSTAPAVVQPTPTPVEEELLTVTKTYTFAGQTTTEDKQIPRSALASHSALGWKPSTAIANPAPTTSTSTSTSTTATATRSQKPTTPHTHRPPKRPSRFDPNPTGYVRALPPQHQISFPPKPHSTSTSTSHPIDPSTALAPPGLKGTPKPTPLNTVTKSRLDWTGFVDQAGIAGELEVYGRSKESYMGRVEFLAGVEGRRAGGR